MQCNEKVFMKCVQMAMNPSGTSLGPNNLSKAIFDLPASLAVGGKYPGCVPALTPQHKAPPLSSQYEAREPCGGSASEAPPPSNRSALPFLSSQRSSARHRHPRKPATVPFAVGSPPCRRLGTPRGHRFWFGGRPCGRVGPQAHKAAKRKGGTQCGGPEEGGSGALPLRSRCPTRALPQRVAEAGGRWLGSDRVAKFCTTSVQTYFCF